jgi:murein DD-endopeptidase MepM/ murein hydrolase activator NlpD
MTGRRDTAARWAAARRRATHERRRDESFLMVTLAQGVLCALMLAAALMLSGYFGMTELKAAFYSMLSRETQAVEVVAVVQKAQDSDGLRRAKSLVQSIIDQIAGGESILSGQGGALPVFLEGGATQLSAPEGTTLATVVLSAPMAQPVQGRLTSKFGFRLHPVTGQSDFHTGVDLAAPAGTPIAAAYPGVVSEVGQSRIYGNFVVLDHGGFQTRYCHCETILARVGMKLRQRETIATVGNTGVSTGAHLHFELWVDKKAADPMAGAQGWTLL